MTQIETQYYSPPIQVSKVPLEEYVAFVEHCGTVDIFFARAPHVGTFWSAYCGETCYRLAVVKATMPAKACAWGDFDDRAKIDDQRRKWLLLYPRFWLI
jgi:hypothetical protein